MGRCKLSLRCETTSDERSAGKPHATFCGSRGWATAPGDPVAISDDRPYCDNLTPNSPTNGMVRRIGRHKIGMMLDDIIRASVAQLLPSTNMRGKHSRPRLRTPLLRLAFRRYEDASLRYTGIESHERLTHYGLYDTVIGRERAAASFIQTSHL